jgi:hypothetical protein
MCGKPGKGRHGTSHHAKAIYQIYHSMSGGIIKLVFVASPP